MKNAAFPINIPNSLTILRILLTPLFVILLLRHEYRYALVVFTAAGVSDGLDGFIAKYFNQRTLLGAFLDPIADKLLITSAYVCLAVLSITPSWLTVIVLSRDVIICLGVAIFGIFHVQFEVKPTLISKTTTVFQILTILLTLIDPDPSALSGIKYLMLWPTAALTILSGLHYIYIGVSILQDAMESDGGTG